MTYIIRGCYFIAILITVIDIFINKALAEITAQAKYNSKVDLLVSNLPAYEKSNRELSSSLIALTHELKSSNERQVRERQDKEKQDALLSKVIEDIGEIKIKITRMEARGFGKQN